jgi:hypothetical protein
VQLQRIGTAIGIDQLGEQRFVSVYRDGPGYKLSGPGGSRIINESAIESALKAVAEQYRLTGIKYQGTTRTH